MLIGVQQIYNFLSQVIQMRKNKLYICFGFLRSVSLFSPSIADISINETSSTLTANSANNISVGTTALGSLTSGEDNIAIGDNSTNSLTTGSQNISFGDNSGSGITTGQENIAIGDNTLASSGSGSGNIAIGSSTLSNATGNDNIVIGRISGSSITTGQGNIIIGNDTGFLSPMIVINIIDSDSSSGSPLIEGDMQANTLTVNGTFNTDNMTLDENLLSLGHLMLLVSPLWIIHLSLH